LLEYGVDLKTQVRSTFPGPRNLLLDCRGTVDLRVGMVDPAWI
jgi:hypothetical protein